jgi:hypothetical protein
MVNVNEDCIYSHEIGTKKISESHTICCGCVVVHVL